MRDELLIKTSYKHKRGKKWNLVYYIILVYILNSNFKKFYKKKKRKLNPNKVTQLNKIKLII